MASFSLQHIDQPFIPCFGTFDAVNNCGSVEKAGFSNNETFLSNKCGDDSSTVVESYYKGDFGEQVTQKKVEKMERKRSNRNGSSLISSSPSMDGNEVKSKKQKKSKNEDKEKKTNKKGEKKNNGEAPTEYVHVRARRGQATDSHSLAERVRREKIRERMKILQGLVPGCDKVTGKALMLDEIINYVQSLQNQVESLSLKLASLNPMFLEFETELDNFIITPEAERLHKDPPFFTDTITGLTTPTDIYSLLDHATSSLLFDPQTQRPNILTQENGQAVWNVILDDQEQKLNNEFGLLSNNLCSFY